MTGGFDWAFWSVGGVLGAAGLAFIGRGLLRDRPRGRRRCPKCWYELTYSAGLVCSECGYRAKHEKRLRSTRPHWWEARLGLLLLLLGVGCAWTPRVQSDGWWSIAPTTLLVLLMPDLGQLSPRAYQELMGRFQEGRPWSWQWHMLIDGGWSRADPFFIVSIETADRWPQGVPLYGDASLGLGSCAERWLGNSPVRMRVIPAFDRTAAGVVWPDLTSSWWSASPPSDEMPYRAMALGVPPAGAHELEFKLVIERLVGDAPALARSEFFAAQAQWQAVHSRRLRVPVRIEGTIGEYIAADDSVTLTEAVRGAIRFELDNRSLNVRVDDAVFGWTETSGATCPVMIELLRDGRVVAAWPDWWTATRPAAGRRAHGISAMVTGGLRPFGTPDYASYTWSVRIRGHAERAVLDEAARRYWAGEFEVPLYLVDRPDVLVYRSWPDTADELVDGRR